MTKTCENCQWAESYRPSGPHGPQLYECRFNPPQMVVVGEQSSWSISTPTWPVVQPDDYCSHFQPREAVNP